jgi:hypothetical protein
VFDRKLDTSTRNPHPAVSERRAKFDVHLDRCRDCQPELCSVAQAMWRSLCLSALRNHPGGV